VISHVITVAGDKW